MSQESFVEEDRVAFIQYATKVLAGKATPTVKQAKHARGLFRLLPEAAGGGNLHIVLDDGNTEDRWVESCVERSVKANDLHGYLMGKILQRMSEKQRDKCWGY